MNSNLTYKCTSDWQVTYSNAIREIIVYFTCTEDSTNHIGFSIFVLKDMIGTTSRFFITGGSSGNKDFYVQIALSSNSALFPSVYINGNKINDVSVTFYYR